MGSRLVVEVRFSDSKKTGSLLGDSLNFGWLDSIGFDPRPGFVVNEKEVTEVEKTILISLQVDSILR